MRIVIITQDEPFYLAENIDYFIKNLPSRSEVVACCVAPVSPFGTRESFLSKASKTLSIFGVRFFTYYTVRFFLNRLSSRKRVRDVLARHGVPILDLAQSINDPKSIAALGAFMPDLLISIAGNQIFKRPLIDLAPKGCLNLHTALLPKYRGLMPSFWVLKNKEAETGVSVFFVDEGIDSGPLIVQERVEIGDRTQEELIRHTKKIGMDAIIKAVNLIERGNYALLENNAADMTYFTFPTRQDVQEFLLAGKRFF